MRITACRSHLHSFEAFYGQLTVILQVYFETKGRWLSLMVCCTCPSLDLRKQNSATLCFSMWHSGKNKKDVFFRTVHGVKVEHLDSCWSGLDMFIMETFGSTITRLPPNKIK